MSNTSHESDSPREGGGDVFYYRLPTPEDGLTPRVDKGAIVEAKKPTWRTQVMGVLAGFLETLTGEGDDAVAAGVHRGKLPHDPAKPRTAPEIGARYHKVTVDWVARKRDTLGNMKALTPEQLAAADAVRRDGGGREAIDRALKDSAESE